MVVERAGLGSLRARGGDVRARVRRETDAILPIHLYNQTSLRLLDLVVIAGIADAVSRRYQVRVVLAGPAAAVLQVIAVGANV